MSIGWRRCIPSCLELVAKKRQKFLSHLKVPELQVCGRSEMEDLGNLEDRANHRITRSFSYSPEDS